MNTEKLENNINKIKERLPETFNEVLYLVVPFYKLHQKIFDGTVSIQEDKYNITNSEFDVMRCIKMSQSEDNTLSPTQIYQKLMFTSGAITKVLKKLEKKQYIIRLATEYDKRSKLVQLTKAGHKVIQKAILDVFAFEEECFSHLNEEEKKTFKNLTMKMLQKI